MQNAVIPVEIKGVIPASGGCAVFLGNEEKVFIIYIDQMVGMALMLAMRGVPKERPLTHDLIVSILAAYGVKVERVVINDFNDNIYYARLILSADNELHQRKIMEIDARPSDCLAVAARTKAPLFVSQHVWEHAADESEMLRQMQNRAEEPGEDEPPLFGE